MRLKLVLAFSITFIVALLIGYTLGTLTTQRKISNIGSIKAIGVDVFSDLNCTEPILQIKWGILEPNTSKTIATFVKNSGNSPVTLIVYAQNWLPVNCTDYMTLTASPNNALIQPSQVIEVNLTLSVASDVHGIIDFSFDIVFNGSG